MLLAFPIWRCCHCDSHVKVRLTETETERQRDRDRDIDRDRDWKQNVSRVSAPINTHKAAQNSLALAERVGTRSLMLWHVTVLKRLKSMISTSNRDSTRPNRLRSSSAEATVVEAWSELAASRRRTSESAAVEAIIGSWSMWPGGIEGDGHMMFSRKDGTGKSRCRMLCGSPAEPLAVIPAAHSMRRC